MNSSPDTASAQINMDQNLLNRAQGAFVGMAVGEGLANWICSSAHRGRLEGDAQKAVVARVTYDTAAFQADVTDERYFQLIDATWLNRLKARGILHNQPDAFFLQNAYAQDFKEAPPRPADAVGYITLPYCGSSHTARHRTQLGFIRHCAPSFIAHDEDHYNYTWKVETTELETQLPTALYRLLHPKTHFNDPSRESQLEYPNDPDHDEATQEGCICIRTMLMVALSGAGKAAVLAVQPHEDVVGLRGTWFEQLNHDPIPPIGGLTDAMWTLRAAYSAIAIGNDFETTLAAMLTCQQSALMNDLDHHAAIVGQIAGALYGYDNIPARWLERIDGETHANLKEDARALIEHGQSSQAAAPDTNALERRIRAPKGFVLKDPLVKAIFDAEGKPDWSKWPPELVSFEDAHALILCLDGYEAAQVMLHDKWMRPIHIMDDLGAAAHIARRVAEAYRATGTWAGSAIELWVTAFFEARSQHFTVPAMSFQRSDGTWDTVVAPGTDPIVFDPLVVALRTALIAGNHVPPPVS